MKLPVEILAPAGSVESMKAAVNAGADAVYMGGSRFGARAYAENPEGDQFLEALDYAHLHGCSLYMTVNTLVKEEELGQLYDFLLPCYERGLDAVIVQDMGVFSFIRKHFPDLPIHASTQMTVTGWRSAAMLKELGASRVVMARELSLAEIAQIRDHVDIEIESFVHGALCYCYSGQCLLSSLIGGRSGNRGRCAQPCRLPYDAPGQALSFRTGQERGAGRKNRESGVEKGVGKTREKTREKRQQEKDNRYLMSLKDLCTLDILPDIIEAGVYSLKIEGRMKSPRYTAGVVSVYRKYVDQFLERGREGYRVTDEDRRMLLDLFDRGGQTEGYYRQHNGRDMIALKEKPAFRQGNQQLFDRLDEEYVHRGKQEPIRGHVTAREGQPVTLYLEKQPVSVTVSGEVVQKAQNQPMTEEKLLKQIQKTGGSPFYFEELTGQVEGSCFLPVQALNGLRRAGMEQLEEAILSPYRRTAEPGADAKEETAEGSAKKRKRRAEGSGPELLVSLESPEGLAVAAAHPEVDGIYLDSTGFGPEQWKQAAEQCHRSGKVCGLILPQIFRQEAERFFASSAKELREAGFDVLVIRSMEEPRFLKELGLEEIPLVFDSNLYAMNHQAAEQMSRMGAGRLTFPLELNSRELEQLKEASDGIDWEMTVYGHYPAMVSAQCIVRTTKGCTKKPELLVIRDRVGKELPVKNHCRFCFNTIYNPSPLSLLGQEEAVLRLQPAGVKLVFTKESPEQIQEIMDAFADHFRYGKDTPSPVKDFTRGHFRRGVE